MRRSPLGLWVATLVRSIFAQPSAAEVGAQLERVIEHLQALSAKASRILAEAVPEIAAFCSFPTEHWRQIWSNNPQERLNRKIRRRTDVVARGTAPRPPRKEPSKMRTVGPTGRPAVNIYCREQCCSGYRPAPRRRLAGVRDALSTVARLSLGRGRSSWRARQLVYELPRVDRPEVEAKSCRECGPGMLEVAVMLHAFEGGDRKLHL